MVKNKLFTLNCNQRLLTISKPIVMGILNATPNSFYNKGTQSSLPELLENAHKMTEEGATLLDIGGMSTKPNAPEISVQEELDRVLPVLEQIKKEIPNAYISIDTYRSEVAEKCIAHGADLINDIGGTTLDTKMIETIAKHQVPYICMHIQGNPQTMQQNPTYHNVCNEVYQFLYNKKQQLIQHQIHDVIIDVGFGFGKTIAHNYELLKHLAIFQNINAPILVGISRKSMIYKPLHSSSEHALNGTTALHMVALQQGANILRVHDVKEAMECIELHEMLT